MQRRTLVLGGVVLAGAALVLFCCSGRERTPPPAVPGPTPQATSAATRASPPVAVEPAASTQPDAATLGEPDASAAAAPAPPSSAQPAPGGSRIVTAVRTQDARDLRLLAAVERQLGRDPPPEIHALVAARARGARREELLGRIQALPDLGLRVIALRWLDEVAPAAPAAGP